MTMKDLPSPRRAERMQAAKREFLPPIWPLLVALLVIVLIATWVAH
jgi:hypothetical protein